MTTNEQQEDRIKEAMLDAFRAGYTTARPGMHPFGGTTSKQEARLRTEFKRWYSANVFWPGKQPK